MIDRRNVSSIGPRTGGTHPGLRRYAVQVGDESEARTPGARVNIIHVAERAGVSPATVSRSLRGLAKVAPETRQRVMDAANELSYVASLRASGPADGSRRSIAVIVPFITRWFFSTVTAGAVDYLRDSGYDVVLHHLGNADIRDHFFERMPIDPRVEGILTLSMPLTEEHTLALRALDLPMVSVGTTVPGSPSVGIDEATAARAAVNHLLHLKHQRIGFIAGAADDPRFNFISSKARRHGYEQALQAAGLPVDERLIATGPHGLDGGAAAMAQLLSRPILPTAVFAEYDELAIGALWALRRSGLDVPGDISIVGVDDHEMAQMLDLTTVAQGAATQGEVAAQLLLQVLQDDAGDAAHDPVLLPTKLILRGTTSPPASIRSTPHRRTRSPDRGH